MKQRSLPVDGSTVPWLPKFSTNQGGSEAVLLGRPKLCPSGHPPSRLRVEVPAHRQASLPPQNATEFHDEEEFDDTLLSTSPEELSIPSPPPPPPLMPPQMVVLAPPRFAAPTPGHHRHSTTGLNTQTSMDFSIGHCGSEDNYEDQDGEQHQTAQQREVPTISFDVFPLAIHFRSSRQVYLEASSNDDEGRITPASLAARLSIFIRQLTEYLHHHHHDRFTVPEDRSTFIVACLNFLGWGVKELRLSPPTPSYNVVDQHSFWLLSPPPGVLFSGFGADHHYYQHDDEANQFIIDFRFAELFVVARPIPLYQRFLGQLRSDFVGTVAELRGAIRVFSIWAGRSLEQQEMEIPPWRRSHFLESCFGRSIESIKTEFPHGLPFLELPGPLSQMVGSFLTSVDPGLWSFVDFRNIRAASWMFSSSCTFVPGGGAIPQTDSLCFEKVPASSVPEPSLKPHCQIGFVDQHQAKSELSAKLQTTSNSSW